MAGVREKRKYLKNSVETKALSSFSWSVWLLLRWVENKSFLSLKEFVSEKSRSIIINRSVENKSRRKEYSW